MSPKWRYYILGYLLALPQTLVGLLVFVAFYRAHDFHWHSGVLTCVADKARIWGHPDGQTQGFVQVYASEEERGRAYMRVHENCHVVQAFVLGPLFPLLYGLCYIYSSAQGQNARRDQAFEAQAYEREEAFVAHPYPAWGA